MNRRPIVTMLVVATVVLWLGHFALHCGSPQGGDREWVVLDGKHATALMKQCSRPTPEDLDGVWDPDTSDIARLESRLDEVHGVQAEGCCLPGARVDDVHSYYRQYVGIVVHGRRLIYINAFRRGTEGAQWLEEPVIWCDGGKAFWGAVFDPETGRFSQLAFNGIA